MNWTLALNAASCACIFWVAGAFLFTQDRPTKTGEGALQLGLLLTMCGAMIAGLAPYRYDLVPAWWHLLLRGGTAIVALCLYDLGFGLIAQLKHAFDPIRTAPSRLRAYWQRAIANAHRHAATKRTSP